MQRTVLVSLVGVMLLIFACPAAGAIGDQPYGFDMILNSYQQIMYDGQLAWEYVYDAYLQKDMSGRTSDIYNIYLHGVDPAGLLNLWTPEDGGNGNFYDFWGSGHAGITAGSYFGPIWNVNAPSYGLRDTDTWVIDPTPEQQQEFHWNYDADFAATHGTINTWHTPTEYGHNGGFSSWTYSGAEPWDFSGDDIDDGLRFFYGHWGATGWSDDPELILTIRLVHTDGPGGEVNLRFDNGYGGNKDAGSAIGPDPSYVDETPGDFDGDGDVNAADIDALCDQIGLPYDAEFDLDNGTGTGTADGVVDDIDLIYLIEELVEWDNGVDTGVGTKQADFNLDGVVNATDLAIMKGTFGTSGVDYADGNANCDDIVNATDLAILKGTFGFIAVPSPGGGVPEPATLALLTMGGMALLRRRRS